MEAWCCRTDPALRRAMIIFRDESLLISFEEFYRGRKMNKSENLSIISPIQEVLTLEHACSLS